MWVFLSTRLRTWLLLAVVVPALGWLLGKLGDLLEARHGPTKVTRLLHGARHWLRRRPRGRGRRLERASADPIGPRDAGVPAR